MKYDIIDVGGWIEKTRTCREERLVVAWGRTTEKRKSSHGKGNLGSRAWKCDLQCGYNPKRK